MVSPYDDLLDKYHQIGTTRKGTKYEILAAMVCKTLEESSVVVHDVKLRGRSDVKHQIDVTVNKDGAVRRILIECKDFAVSGSKVGLGVVRNFESAARDLGSTEAWIVSNIGFTQPAQQFAKSKGIDLKVARVVEEKDLAGRVLRIVIGFHIPGPVNVRAGIEVESKQRVEELQEAFELIGMDGGVRRDDDVFFKSGSERVAFNEYVSKKLMEDISLEELPSRQSGIVGKDREVVLRPEWPLYVGKTRFEDARVRVKYDVWVDVEVTEVAARRIAELIIEGFGSEDVLIFGDDIARRSLRDSGHVD